MERYRDPIRLAVPGRESYPTMSSNSRTLPRPKSLVFGAKNQEKLRKYKSVVTLKSSDMSSSVVNYQRKATPVKTTSPTHEAVVRRMSKSEAIRGRTGKPASTSEYFSMSPHDSSDDSDDNCYA
jgi:hypothetical protein